MKKIIVYICTFILCCSLSGCSRQTTVSLKEDVFFSLEDVMVIKNKESNSIYYYYMAVIDNQSNKSYDTSLLSFSLTDDKDDDLNAIDRYMSTPSNSISPNESTYVYGFVGFPNNNQKDIGIYFPKTDEFLSFHSVKQREADNNQIQKNGNEKFTLFEDSSMSINVDASQTKTDFKDGLTTLNDLMITYTNKTDHMIVVPYLEPEGILNGLILSDYSQRGNFNNMSLEDYKKIDFSADGLAPKTENIKGNPTGYILYFLEPEQSVKCNIGFTFENAGIDFTDKDKDVFTINLISSSFGSTTSFNLSY